MKKEKLKIAVIYGSVRSGRTGIGAAKFIVNQLKKRGHAPVLIDPQEFKLPLLNKMYKEYKKGKAPAILQKLYKIIKPADAYVIVSAEYNHSPPPALINLLDHFLEEYFFKPSAIVSYSAGPWGGVRAASHLRDFLAEMGMPAIPTSLPITAIQNTFDKNGHDLTGKYEKRSDKLFKELEWYASAFKAQRKKGLPY